MASFSDDKVGGMHKASSFQVSLDVAAGCPLRPEGKTETSLYAILQRRPRQILAWEQLWYATTDAMLVFFNSSHSSPFSKTLMNNIQNKLKDKRHLRVELAVSPPAPDRRRQRQQQPAYHLRPERPSSRSAQNFSTTQLTVKVVHFSRALTSTSRAPCRELVTFTRTHPGSCPLLEASAASRFTMAHSDPSASKVVDIGLSEEFAVPSHVEEVKKLMAEFAERHGSAGRRVVLITSGGTKVPLESRTVRFLDNFSSGRRGASSAEYFLDSGYAVIFLHRHRSLYPYTRLYTGVNLLDSLRLETSKEDAGQVLVDQNALPNIANILKRYQAVKVAGLLLPVEFNTLSEYLHLLKAAAQALSSIGSKAMFYLAAAVSDFYIPAYEMPEHKIQSSNGPLQISMKMVPKMLSPLVKDWAPKAFVTSFKLETDPSILLERARRALETYNHQAVVANVLDTRRGYVVVVTKDTQQELVLTDEEVQKEVEIEDRIVSNLTAAHSQFMSQQI
ncbi:hypothetical protein Q8A67_021360 [Cirrhinus molitorella]|uniref:Phosphopantothenate--cysteine ligase n=1 Tax=Cirrhinus molitorella TaxID=172907 RepID=A0AA88PBB6_9TELE|nr:hypothetical protein Q8A67_021360 [Cirrhinus molitorella]